MSKQSKAEPSRSADGAKSTFEFYEHAELGLNAESVPDALAGYWTRVLARAKERSEPSAPKKHQKSERTPPSCSTHKESKSLLSEIG